jgi:DNA-directed RNA polymerase sigma subunit (sigma70/sigma32)
MTPIQVPRIRGEYLVKGSGMTFQEIADELGISNVRAQQLLNSAIRKIRQRHPETLLKMKTEAEGLNHE